MSEELINAEGQIMGRIASWAAKKALLGEKVIIVNCSKAVITGNKYAITEKYLEKRRLGGSALRGPYIHSSSEKIMKRAIRGMMNYKKGRSTEAFKSIRCYNEVPEEFKDKIKKPEKIQSGMKLKELSKRIKE